MAAFRIIYDEKKCIGSGVCESLCSEFWHVTQDMKSELKGATPKGDGVFELEIEEKDFACNKMAADGCPPGCMQILDLKTGQFVKLDK